jgi:hypothetical protein
MYGDFPAKNTILIYKCMVLANPKLMCVAAVQCSSPRVSSWAGEGCKKGVTCVHASNYKVSRNVYAVKSQLYIRRINFHTYKVSTLACWRSRSLRALDCVCGSECSKYIELTFCRIDIVPIPLEFDTCTHVALNCTTQLAHAADPCFVNTRYQTASNSIIWHILGTTLYPPTRLQIDALQMHVTKLRLIL